VNDITLAITNWRRSKYLRRCLASAHEAGFENVVVTSSEPDAGVLKVLDDYRKVFGNGLRVSISDVDRTCHGEWLNAAYHSPTERLIIMHDDDVICSKFGEAYTKILKFALDSGVGIASWRAHLLYDNNSVKPTEYFSRDGKPSPTGVYPIAELENIVGRKGRLSLSPVVSIMNRKILISALKEMTQEINDPKCLYRPGMNLGTEILAYLRHCSSSKDWFFLSEVLSMYGSHAGSGTVDAQVKNELGPLIAGYDVVRDHWYSKRRVRFTLDRKVLLVYSDYQPSSEEESNRLKNAMHSWKFHFEGGQVLDFPVRNSDLPRTSKDIGDPRAMPMFNDIIDWAMKFAMPEDIVAYINRDVALTTRGPDILIGSANMNFGAAVAFRRNIKEPQPGRLYHTVRNYPPDGGFDCFAFTPQWWSDNKAALPEMYIGREAYDTCVRNLIEEVASRKKLDHLRVDFWNNPYYCDDVCWHTDHVPYWQENKLTNPSQIHNRTVCRKFFEERNNAGMMWALDSAPKPGERVPPRKRLIDMGGFKKERRS
jgi:hypothetical protein